VIDSGEVGGRVPGNDAEALAAAVVRYLADPGLRRASGQRARSAVLHRYSLERLVRDIAELYAELVPDAQKTTVHH
jgi:mannosyltransferase